MESTSFGDWSWIWLARFVNVLYAIEAISFTYCGRTSKLTRQAKEFQQFALVFSLAVEDESSKYPRLCPRRCLVYLVCLPHPTHSYGAPINPAPTFPAPIFFVFLGGGQNGLTFLLFRPQTCRPQLKSTIKFKHKNRLD